MRKVIVVAYDHHWPAMFEGEATLIRHILGSELLEIHHIGSTSVPGLAAKPIIDMMPVVKDITNIDRFNHQMMAIGYTPKGEYGILGRRFFYKGNDERTHHIHVFQQGSEHIERHLAFRDYLRQHPLIAMKYGQLKQALATQYATDIDGYMEGKDAFIKEIETDALTWFHRS